VNAIFRFGLCHAAASPTENRLKDIRWSLTAVDPRGARLRCGSFQASDRADVPYRLWLARNPRAAVLLLHGACDYSGAFDEIAPRLARRGLTGLAIDQRGFGATATRGHWSGQDRMAEDVVDALEFLDRRLERRLPIFILGESMGGAVAIHAAAQFRLRASGMVLVAPGAVASLCWSKFLAVLVRLLNLLPQTRELVFDRLSGWDLSPSAAIRLMGDPLVLRTIRPEILSGLLCLSRAVVSEAKAVTIPALTLVGNRDDVLREGCIRRLHDNLAGEKVWQTIQDGPHLLLDWQRGYEVLVRAQNWIERHLASVGAVTPNRAAQCVMAGAALSAPGGAAARPTNIIKRLCQSVCGTTYALWNHRLFFWSMTRLRRKSSAIRTGHFFTTSRG
jgi:acylglycerol lipase